jgi:Arm DNA-binding domain
VYFKIHLKKGVFATKFATKILIVSSVNFYLNKADRKDQCPIMLTYQLNGKRFRYWTKLKINKKGWGKQRVKMNYIDAEENNAILADLENKIKEIEREALFNKKEFSIETVKRKFELKIGELSSTGNFF